MDRKEFLTLARTMKAVYTDPKFLADNFAIEVWYEMLKDLPYKVAADAIQRHMQTSKFLPTIADLRENVQKNTAPEEMTAIEAWRLTYRAICNANYHAEEEFNRLPEVIQKTIGSPDTLKEWAKMDTGTVESVEQSHFIRDYNATVKRCKEVESLSPEIRSRLELQGTTQNLIGE